MKFLKYMSIRLGLTVLLVSCSSSQDPSVNDGLKALPHFEYEYVDLARIFDTEALKDKEGNPFFPEFLSYFTYVVPKDWAEKLTESTSDDIPRLHQCSAGLVINQKKYVPDELEYKIKFYADDLELGEQKVHKDTVASLLMEVNGVHFREAKQISFEKKVWAESNIDDLLRGYLVELKEKNKLPDIDLTELESQVYAQTLSFEVDTYQISGDPIRCGFQVKTIPAQVTATAAWIKDKDGKWVAL